MALLAIFLLTFAKLWRSLRLGLVRLSASIWAAFVAISWLSIESHHPRIAIGVVSGFCVLVSLTSFLRKSHASSKVESSEAAKVELPVSEELGLGEAIDALVATIALERPLVVAVTGAYGRGKTSFVNLTLGKLRKLEETDRPIIVKFSQWLAAVRFCFPASAEYALNPPCGRAIRGHRA